MPGAALRAKPRIEQQDRHALDQSYVHADLAEAGLDVLETKVAAESDHGSRYMVVARPRPPRN
jgi:hypothetical protein